LYAYDETIVNSKENIVILEYRGLKKIIDENILQDGEELYKFIKGFSSEFFKI